jgi:hypothetical protein
MQDVPICQLCVESSHAKLGDGTGRNVEEMERGFAIGQDPDGWVVSIWRKPIHEVVTRLLASATPYTCQEETCQLRSPTHQY